MNYEIEFDTATVECELIYEIDNDSFDHAFGTEVLPDYPVLLDVTFDHSLYSQEAAKKIQAWIDDHFDEIKEYLQDNWQPDTKFY